ncbi:c-type cytochrome biogenesis protein CcmI [Brevundimonas sp. LM2]|uniref:c-type cytochrome biogenesis protein CcmI n=1 Tax=Brevundimonas sp. LM2 TaxID=1938605 RepID=UPI000983BC86|nr:c-type cytochrome biogenesis protein CcmI [Brevundimonas sp. LM2]AQR60997.1 c-type cytochrome biogenesis protein CcmI [Brevundimonas sp. LM2]
MIVFWTLAGLAAALAGWLVLGAARNGLVAVPAPSDTAAAELAELDRLRTRGLLDEDAYVGARAEAGRRLLADTAPEPVVRVGPRDRTVVLSGLVATAAVAVGLYVLIGQPGLPDQVYERRIDQWTTSPETLDAGQMAAVLTRAVRRDPDNRTALTMLGAARFQADDPIGAASAFRRALEIDPNDAQSWARLGESLVRANEGTVGADAEAAFVAAIRRDPDQLGARFFLGRAALDRGDGARARVMWEPLIAVLDPGDPRRAGLQAELAAAG